jgi:hypothetical protein
MQEILLFAKFDPSPKGSSKYTDNQDGFDLITDPVVHTMAQGSGSGAQVNALNLTFKGTKVQAATFQSLVKTNNKTPTKLTYTNMETINGKRTPLEKAEYEGLEFKNVLGEFTQGEPLGRIHLQATYTKVKSQLKEYDAKGKAGPSAKVDDDFEKGTFK